MTTGTKEVKIINKKGVVVINRIHQNRYVHIPYDSICHKLDKQRNKEHASVFEELFLSSLDKEPQRL